MSVELSTLANGLRVVSHAMPELETASLGLWIGAGARYERADQNGISHLLEHMAFKGTARRSARAIAEEIESAGGELNAATSVETTAYYARVLKGDEALALDILADILQEPLFDQADLAREQEVVLQEIAASQDTPDDVAFDLVHEAAFPDQPLGRTILGTPSSVRKVQPDHLHAYRAEHYRPGAMVLGGAGAVEHGALVKLGEALFSDPGEGRAQLPEQARYRGGLRMSDGTFEQNHIIAAYRGPSYHEQGYYAAQVLSGLLGGGMSSRLFQEARERRGLCYSIYSFAYGFSDCGLFGVHAASGPGRLDELMAVISDELQRVAAERPKNDEIARAKAQLKAGLLMSLESSSSRAEQVARQTLAYGAPIPVPELIARVEAVGPEEARTAAAGLISGSAPAIAAVGTRRSLERIERLAAKFPTPSAQAAE